MYRDDVTALAARHTALETELAAKTKELADATRTLEDARAARRLPVLANIKVAAPCPAAWDKMTGDDRVRTCADCDKQVFNLSDLTRAEAEALITEKAGGLCVNYWQRSDGTILLKDCTVGIVQRRRRRAIAVGAVALLAGGGALGHHLAHRGAVALQPGEVEFDDSDPSPRDMYHIAQSVEEPPVPVIHIMPVPKVLEPEKWERTGGAVAITGEELKALTETKLPEPKLTETK